MSVETMYDERLHTDERYGDPASGDTSPDTAAPEVQASGPRNTIPFEMSDGDTIPDDVLLECPEYDREGEGSDGCAQGGECPYAGNESACADGGQ